MDTSRFAYEHESGLGAVVECSSLEITLAIPAWAHVADVGMEFVEILDCSGKGRLVAFGWSSLWFEFEIIKRREFTSSFVASSIKNADP